jgi:sugar transferase (PEP-CTERM/EpsH1 system associated)
VISTVQVIYSLEIGGAEKLAATIGAHLDRKKFRPVICALDADGPLADELRQREIPYHVLWRKGIEAGVLARLYRCFRQEKARIVHTHQFPQLLFSLLPARLAGAKVVHTEHEFYTYRDHPWARRLFRQLSRFCSALTVVGPEVARYYTEELGIHRRRIHIIANGVDLHQFNFETEAARRRLELSTDDVVFGIVGRLEPEKDHRTLLQAFRALVDHRKAARLLIIGDGSLRGELESHSRSLGLERNVTFLGARTDIPELLAALDVFVLSSVHEGVPLSVIEAMGAGKPIVATDVGGMRLLVKPSINGLLVPAANPAALAAAMENLAANPALRREFGVHSRRMAHDSFSVSTMIERYQEIYEAVFENRDVRN